MQLFVAQRSSPPGTFEPEQSPPTRLLSPQKPLSPVSGYAALHLVVVAHDGVLSFFGWDETKNADWTRKRDIQKTSILLRSSETFVFGISDVNFYTVVAGKSRQSLQNRTAIYRLAPEFLQGLSE